jgi:cation diffusion facilitator family transporter
MEEGSKKAIMAAFVANLGIAVAKFAGFFLTGSAGMLAEAGHSLADTGNQGLLLVGSKKSRRQPTAEHPFGFGRERYFWSFVVALVLFSMGGVFALYEGIEKLVHPHTADRLGAAIVILVLSIGLETFSLMTGVREARHIKPASMTWWRFIRTARHPELPIVLLEDTGAEAGLLFALFGVIMASATDNPRWDAVGSIAIGLLLVCIAIVLAVEMKSLLIGESAEPDVETAIMTAIESHPLVNSLIHMRTEHLGPEEVLVAAKVEFHQHLSIAELADAVDSVEAAIRATTPTAHLIYLEPDIRRIPAS